MMHQKRIAVLSDDTVFVRMLNLELLFRSYSLADEKNAELIIIDTDTHSLPKTQLPCIRFGRKESDSDTSLHRPFEMRNLFSLIENTFSDIEDGEPIIAGEDKISVAGEIISLSGAEMALFKLLLDERGTAISRERIAREIFPDANNGSKVADVYICYLRKKIDEKLGYPYIRTLRGKGYMIK